MIQTHDLPAVFDREIPVEAVRGIVRAIQSAYRASNECCAREYDERIHHQAWGYHRWLKIDSELLAVGQRFGNVSRFRANTEQTHLGHTELHFGPLVLTAASVPDRGRVPKPAKYRKLLAESNQFALFERRRKHHAQNRKVWGVILHVPNIAAKTPMHIHAGFVTADNDFACPLIDLIERANSVEVEVARTRPALRLRRIDKTSE